VHLILQRACTPHRMDERDEWLSFPLESMPPEYRVPRWQGMLDLLQYDDDSEVLRAIAQGPLLRLVDVPPVRSQLTRSLSE
jgi:hypothetical protein